jgi:ribosomal 50S subunit-recycling heat shock protein
MRLDKYLKLARLIRRRTVAKEAADEGLVLVNGRAAKPSHEVRVGDRIEVRLGGRRLEVEVVAEPDGLPVRRLPESFRTLRDGGEEQAED